MCMLFVEFCWVPDLVFFFLRVVDSPPRLTFKAKYFGQYVSPVSVAEATTSTIL
jgi:hypothetical protein